MKRRLYLLILLFLLISLSGFLLSWYTISELRSSLSVMIEAGRSMVLRDRLHIGVEQMLRLRSAGVSTEELSKEFQSISAVTRQCKDCHHPEKIQKEVNGILEGVGRLQAEGFPLAALHELTSRTDEASEEGQKLMEKRSLQALRLTNWIFPLFIGTVFLLLGLLVLFTILITERVRSYIEQVLSATRKIAEGKETTGEGFSGEFSPLGDAFLHLQREIRIREEKLLNWSERWQNTFDSINEMMAVTDHEGGIIQMNRAFRNGFPGAGEGMSLYETLCEGLVTLEEFTIEETIRTGKSIHRILEGKDRIIRASTYPLTGESGVIMGGIWVGQDITREREMEERALQSEKLVALGELVAGIAHELNNPLAVSLGYSEILLERKDLSTEDRRKIKKIFDSTKRASNIIRNLLEFARRQPPRNEECNLNEIAERMIDLMIYELQSDGIELQKDFQAVSPVMGDQTQLGQVVLNLLKNAHDALRDIEGKEKDIRVETGETEDGVYLSIADNGPGIPEELLPRVFEPFFTTKDVGKGTGLGLSITYSIVKGHGGELRVDNLPEGGVRFMAIFPVKVGMGDEKEDPHNR